MQVYEEIKRGIIQGHLKAGDRLLEERLAEEFGVSRNPIREAFRLLSSEGLVDVINRRGVYVRAVDDRQAHEVVEIRALLEGQNARLAARRRNPEVLARVAEILRRGRDALSAHRTAEMRSLNEEFHGTLALASENGLLQEMLGPLRLRSALLFAATSPEDQVEDWKEHADILQAILDGDEDRAGLIATSHVQNAGARARKHRAPHQG